MLVQSMSVISNTGNVNKSIINENRDKFTAQRFSEYQCFSCGS